MVFGINMERSILYDRINKIKETLEKANITDFEMAETSYIPYETIELDEELSVVQG